MEYSPRAHEPKFHELDLSHAEAFNRLMTENPDYVLADHLDPYPYTGNQKANVFVLLANPGVSKIQKDPAFEMHTKFREQNLRNLRHESPENFISWIHSSDNPEKAEDWWIPRLKKLVADSSLERVSKNLFFINFHPYNSVSWYRIPFIFPTQEYSFQLVREAMSREALIILARNELGWCTAIPELLNYRKLVRFKSIRSAYISPNNLGSPAYQELLNHL